MTGRPEVHHINIVWANERYDATARPFVQSIMAQVNPELNGRPQRTWNYIGLSCTFHDQALAIVNEAGEVVFAEGTERALQHKRALGCVPDYYPRIARLIEEYCDPNADLVISRTWQYYHYLHIWLDNWFNRKLTWLNPKRRWYRDQLYREIGYGAQYLSCYHAAGVAVRSIAETVKPYRRVIQRDCNHHLCHAAAASFASPYQEAVCAVIDGRGEYCSTGFYHYRDGQLKKLPVRHFSWHSLGDFYDYLCRACGFDPGVGEEWKVMGLAPTGRFNEKAYDLLKKTVRIDGLKITGLVDFAKCPLWTDRQGIAREDLAFTGQQFFEECMTQLLTNLRSLGISDNLVLTGGCALNSSCNGLILEQTGFKNLYVFCAPADDGNAVGAALLSYQRDHPDWRPPVDVQSPFLGSAMGGEALHNLVRFDRSDLVTHHPGQIHEIAAELLADGQIIGWAQGRAEFGPRALGNRSILADARNPDVKNLINGRVKFREEFRPFAPSILHEFGPEYFENYQESPYMDRTLRFRPEVKHKVPGVVHINGTGRLQTVKREWNEKYYDLIAAFHRLTGVPLVLNTSFNIMGKPIIHSVEDAVAVLHTTGLDALIIDDYLIRRPQRERTHVNNGETMRAANVGQH
ncbi:MAG TPA: carbamoyltransferase C-terminal domain-containing protein [Gemmataceae bacterium]|nr:carbamoyltransferase C-terminal domain-containing protein [Gemmataceae bacterium]